MACVFCVQYVFEGLGHLIAKILMSSSQFLETIDESGIHRMCRNIFTMQQTLTNITMAREVALDHANHYFQLFYLTPEVSHNSLELQQLLSSNTAVRNYIS